MTTEKQIEIANAILASGIVTQVFHSCKMLRDDSIGLYPAYQKGEEFVYTGIDDAKGLFGYIRENGDMSGEEFKVASCSRSYEMTAPLRVVFFSDNEKRNHEELLAQLTKFTFMSKVTLVRIITDKFRLKQEESPLFRESFGGNTFYVAFDVSVSFVLLPNTCEPASACITHPNPIKPCPAAATASSSSAT